MGRANKKNVQSLEDYIRNEVYKLCSDEEIKLKPKREASEEEQRKKQAKKRKHLSRGQKEKQDKQRKKKATKRSKHQQLMEPKKEEIITLGATWFPPGTPLKSDVKQCVNVDS